MWKAAASATAILSALALALHLWRIEPFLPERGGTICFAADYTPPRPIDLSSPRRDQSSVGDVKSMRLQTHFPLDEKPFRYPQGGGYDHRYSMRLDARLASNERLSTAAICEWSNTFVDGIMPSLSCYIDCDGGSVTVWRRWGRNGLTVRFEPGERLRTGGSCGEGAAVFMGAEREARSLAVKLTSQQQCAN